MAQPISPDLFMASPFQNLDFFQQFSPIYGSEENLIPHPSDRFRSRRLDSRTRPSDGGGTVGDVTRRSGLATGRGGEGDTVISTSGRFSPVTMLLPSPPLP
jgi:hypothetical protein